MVVVWRVTERCNLNCKFCAYDRELVRSRRQADPERIRAFGRVLAQWSAENGRSALVSWLGGEPLLWGPLMDLTRVFRRDYGLRVATTTNGTALGSHRMREHLLGNYSELTVSVDGIGEVHDRLRGWPGGFAALAQNVSKLAEEKRRRKAGPVLRANVLLMHDTIADFERLCFQLSEWGCEEITFNQLGGLDRPEFYPAHRLFPQEARWLAELIPPLRLRLASVGVRLCGGEAYLDRIRASTLNEHVPVRDCFPGIQFLFINESGIVSPCSFTTPDYGVPLEEISSLGDLKSLPIRFSQLRRRRVAACGDCQSTQVFEKFAWRL